MTSSVTRHGSHWQVELLTHAWRCRHRRRSVTGYTFVCDQSGWHGQEQKVVMLVLHRVNPSRAWNAPYAVRGEKTAISGRLRYGHDGRRHPARWQHLDPVPSCAVLAAEACFDTFPAGKQVVGRMAGVGDA